MERLEPFPVDIVTQMSLRDAPLETSAGGSLARSSLFRNEHAAINRFERIWLRCIYRIGDFRNVRQDHRPIDCRHDQHRKGPPLKLLLVLHILVAGQKYMKAFAFDQLQKSPVFNSAPLHSDHGVYLMLGQGTRQPSLQILIEQNLQC